LLGEVLLLLSEGRQHEFVQGSMRALLEGEGKDPTNRTALQPSCRTLVNAGERAYIGKLGASAMHQCNRQWNLALQIGVIVVA